MAGSCGKQVIHLHNRRADLIDGKACLTKAAVVGNGDRIALRPARFVEEGLDELSKFDGTYYGVDVGAAVGGGGAGLAMRNEHGVYVKLRAAQQGVKLSLASKGTKLAFD